MTSVIVSRIVVSANTAQKKLDTMGSKHVNFISTIAQEWIE